MIRKALILFLVLLLCVSLCACGQQKVRLNEMEQRCYQCALDLKDMMKDPDSFRLYDTMYVFQNKDDEGDVLAEYIIFEYSGTNSYGAVIKNEAVFCDGEYLMNFGDEADPDADNYNDQLFFKAAWSLLEIEIMLSKANGEPMPDELIEIDVEKIKTKMKLK